MRNYGKFYDYIVDMVVMIFIRTLAVGEWARFWQIEKFGLNGEQFLMLIGAVEFGGAILLLLPEPLVSI